MTDALYYHYWGKASAEPETGPAYHLLPYHCLDVAAVGWWLLNSDKPLCKQLAAQLQVEPEWLQRWFVFCLAIHDLGKFARAFQGLRQDLSANLVKANARMPYTERHDSLGFSLWVDMLEASLSQETEEASWLVVVEPWLETVFGHHGVPPKRIFRLDNYFEQEDEQAALQFVQHLIALFLDNFDFKPLQVKALKKCLKPVSWQLAGIAVLADWLGSNQEYFKYCDKPIALKSYWQDIALIRAEQAIAALPEPKLISPFNSIQNLFPFISAATPLQKYAAQEPLAENPQLFILEDVTGAGKTEAALILAQRLMSQGLADGLYIALPTMATANAMYQRLGNVYRKFYQAHSQPSLILAHGARELSQDFQDSVALAEQQITDSQYLHGRQEEDQELSATAYCNAWLADSRKKALLADVGVGTLDQALLAVLPARHQSLRLLGLSRKVLLVDEVHAYDCYMQKLLDALLEAHARQGGSVILLSATLPQEMRQTLVAAFHTGLGVAGPELKKLEAYPLATHTPAATERVEQEIETRDSVKRTVHVKPLANEDEVIARIQQAVAEGQCVCWIRNTVKSARKSYQDLLDKGLAADSISLFHSRFAMIDRQQVENQTLAHFGKDSTPADRKGRVLIATQVVEQSLDLDFDLMISDLAPIDLLIQRAGRLRRHIRDVLGNRLEAEDAQDQRGVPVLYVYTPEPCSEADANWLKPDHAGTQAVYSHVGRLWLTAKLLLEAGQFIMPDDARQLIEGVYGAEAEVQIPPALLDASIAAESKDMAQRSMADLNVLKLNKGYTWMSGDWGEETRIPTRLTEEETISVALAIVENGELKPYAKVDRYPWAMSTVKLPDREWQNARQQMPAHFTALIEVLKAEHKALRWLEVLPLEEGQEIYSAQMGFVG